MALYIPHSIFHLARLLYVRPENFGPLLHNNIINRLVQNSLNTASLLLHTQRHVGLCHSV